MKKILQALAVFITISSTVSAQWVTDTISMGPGYSNNIFYAFGNGVQKTSVANDWHLAFSMNGNDSASVFANQSGNSTTFFTRVYDVNRPISDWANVSYADTLTGSLLYNGPQSWYAGALNAVPAASGFDFGWGLYSPVTHLFTGTRLFIVATGGNFYKLAIDSMDPFTYDWNFRIESMAPTMPPTPTYTISRSNGFNDRIFAYFNIDSGMAYDREPAIATWDFEFIGYPEFIQAGPQTAWRAVTGVLTNRGIPVAQAQMVDVDDAENDYSAMFPPTSAPAPAWINGWDTNPYTTIGYDWKTFDLGTFSYLIPDSNSYFVSAKDGDVYQLQFLSFGGSQTGDVEFRYRNVGQSPVAVNDIEVLGAAQLYPNPASDQARLMFNASENTTANFLITALNGQVVSISERTVQSGLNVFEINTSNMAVGNYLITLQSNGSVIQKKMTVSR